jgi:hypothetical protein
MTSKAKTSRDGRTREAKLVASVRRDLIDHVGGRPSATQSALIDQICQIRLRLSAMDRRFAESGMLSEHDGKQYLAWANSSSRMLRALGTKPARQERGFDHLGDLGDLAEVALDG